MEHLTDFMKDHPFISLWMLGSIVDGVVRIVTVLKTGKCVPRIEIGTTPNKASLPAATPVESK